MCNVRVWRAYLLQIFSTSPVINQAHEPTSSKPENKRGTKEEERVGRRNANTDSTPSAAEIVSCRDKSTFVLGREKEERRCLRVKGNVYYYYCYFQYTQQHVCVYHNFKFYIVQH